MKKKAKRREATAEELAQWKKAVKEESRPTIVAANKAIGRKALAQKKQRTSAARQALIALAAMKEAKGLSLSDLEQATGITRGNLSRLLNNPMPNVTVETIGRLAAAVGARLEIRVSEESAETQLQ